MLMMSSMAAETKIDEESAAEMLNAGESVRDVAHRFGVSTQAIYLAIRQGRLPARARPRLGSAPLASPDSTTPNTPRVGDTNGGTR